jgi:hypothetical protein
MYSAYDEKLDDFSKGSFVFDGMGDSEVGLSKNDFLMENQNIVDYVEGYCKSKYANLA